MAESGKSPEAPLRTGERILPDGRRVRDAHFVLEDQTEAEIQGGVKDYVGSNWGSPAKPETGTHSSGHNVVIAQKSEYDGVGKGTPGPASKTRAPRKLK